MVGAFAVRNNIFDVYIALGFDVPSDFMKRYNIPTTPLVLGLMLGLLMERFYLTSLASYETPAEFLLRPRTATIMGLAFLFLLWSLWPAIKEPIEDLRLRAQDGREKVDVRIRGPSVWKT